MDRGVRAPLWRGGSLWHGLLGASQLRQNLVAGEGRQDDPVGAHGSSQSSSAISAAASTGPDTRTA